MRVSQPPRTPTSVRSDIQGLRALAVLVVIANHMWPERLPGGFVGVDIFFVISGFLITGLLLREWDRTGRISFVRFYARRVKRLVPAALTCILATVVVAYAVLPRMRAESVAWDGVWSFVFVQNWNLAAASTDYFDENSSTSPLQHYWSLSVEEQFYLVWPWLLLALLLLFAKVGASRLGAKRIAGGALVVVIIASFGWAAVQATAEPSVAYFSTLTRGWELGVGALLAAVASRFERTADWIRQLLLYSGLAAMLVSLVVFDSSSVWPAPGALLPVLGAAAVLASGIGKEARWNPLSVRPARVIGDLSYSLYLWHFPVIVFGEFLYPDAGHVGDVVILGLTAVLAASAYLGIEAPIHRSPLWSSPKQPPRWEEWRRRTVPRMTAACAALVVAGAGATTAAVAFTPPSPIELISPEALVSPDANPEVVAAVGIQAWPEGLAPLPDAPRSERFVQAWSVDGCLASGMQPQNSFEELSRDCVYGDPEGRRTAVLIGDSVAVSWATALDAPMADAGWRLFVLTAEMCPASDVEIVRDTGTAYPGCSEFRERAFDFIQQNAPDLVIASETSSTVSRLASGAKGQNAVAELAEGMRSTLETVAGHADEVVVVTSIPRTRSMRECYDPLSLPDSCAFVMQGGASAHRAVLDQATTSDSVPLVESEWFFCVDSVCPPAIAGFMARPDGAHISDAYARHIGPELWDRISRAVESDG